MPVKDRRYENFLYFILGGTVWLILAYLVIVAAIHASKYLWHHL